MDHETAFLDAIAAEPDDLTHRLVFADWLEDHGDEIGRDRAAFIRAQIERASLPAYHPRTRALLGEEARLLERHASLWTQHVAPLVRRVFFQRGFVEEVRLSPEQLLTNGERLFRQSPIRGLQLRGTLELPALLARARNQLLAFNGFLGQIAKLDLNRDYLGETAGLALLQQTQMPRLTSLHLANNSLSAAGIRVLANATILETLETLEVTVANNAADALQGLLHSSHLGKLIRLSLAGTRLGNLVARLVQSPLAPRLRSLSLSHNQITATGLRVLANSRVLARLESLDLSHNPIGPEGVRLLERSSAFTHLKSLNLSRTGIEDSGVRLLANGSLLGRLEAIDLSMNQLSDAAGLALAEYRHPSNLLCLDLIYNSQLSPHAQDAVADRFGEEVCLFER